MCDPVSAFVAVAGAMAYSSMSEPEPPPPAPPPPAPPPPAPAPQAEKVPEVQAVKAGVQGTGQAGGSAGIAQTMLTAAGGVSKDSLNLGKNKLKGQLAGDTQAAAPTMLTGPSGVSLDDLLLGKNSLLGK